MKKTLVALGIIALSVTGCMADTEKNADGKDSMEAPVSQENDQETQESSSVLGYKLSEKSLVIKQFETPVYKAGETAALIADGVLYGTLDVNRSVLLGIWDWYNPNALKYGIKNSYAFNLTVSLERYMEDRLMASIEPEFTLVDSDGNEYSSSCCVGWSGFNSMLEIYQDKATKTVEVGMQPNTSTIKGNWLIRIDLYDSSSKTQFEPIYYDMSLLKNAVKGPKIKEAKDVTEIKSVCGASYSFSIDSVGRSLRNENGEYNEWKSVFDVLYKFKYNEAPTNSRAVTRFGALGKQYANTGLSFFVQTDKNEAKSTEKDPNVQILYNGRLYYYVFGKDKVAPGKSADILTNRVNVVPDDTSSYVRIAVEFPEELNARTEEEALEFEGRYVVYQIELSDGGIVKEEWLRES